METSAQGITAPAAVYEIVGRRFEVGARGFADAVADAHAAHQRPRCMCLVEGVEMYVARLGEGYIVKRMPDTGSHHAPDCPSYEPPAEFSGLGQVLGSAITEDPATGETTLKLDFPLTKMPGRSQTPSAGGESDSVASDGTRLSLRGLLHYLWDQAELTRWHPGFAGKRTWATVRRHLLQAAERKFARGTSLHSRLYLPEVFSVEHRDAISAHRLSHWAQAVPAAGKPQQLMLMVCELKEIVAARYGFKAIIKHLPDQSFAIDEQLFRRLERHFEQELMLWGNSASVRMVMICTFRLTTIGVPTVVELSLMPVTTEWLPIENAFDHELTAKLVHEERHFVKGLRYNTPRRPTMASAMLLDAGAEPWTLSIGSQAEAVESSELVHRAPSTNQSRLWFWRPSQEPMPALPDRQTPAKHIAAQNAGTAKSILHRSADSHGVGTMKS